MADAVGDNTPTNEAMSVDIPCLMHCNGQDSQTQLPVQLAQPVPMESVKNHILQLVTEGIGTRNATSQRVFASTLDFSSLASSQFRLFFLNLFCR
jgi:hypothetical protein